MQLDKLLSNNPKVVEEYVTSKFKTFKSFKYSAKTRTKKCIDYYLAASGSDFAQDIVERVYQDTYGQLFPDQQAERVAIERASSPIKKESGQWLDDQEDYYEDVNGALNDLQIWKRSGDWQEGPRFFQQLVTRVEFVDDTICDARQFNKEFSTACKAEINSSVTMSDSEREAKFDLMVGFEQSAMCSFEAHDENWGDISAKLEQSFKAGLWANGGAKVAMERLGFSAEVQAAIAVGAQLNIDGNLTWKKDNHEIKLGGEAEVFVGARAQGEMKLTVSAIKGLEASIKAGAFAGFSAEAKGYCSYSYDGQTIARVEASAAVTFGAGAEFEASIKAPIFGPTEISFKANLTLGFGTAVGTTAEIDFSEAALAASTEFRKVVYWRTMAKGYEMDLMNSDAKNLYYLNKAIGRLKDELQSTGNAIKSHNSVPMEKRSLLI